jgi:NAD(P)-dependent dehydrogenase (short-subunit alcohol dehydrogenase family)
MIDLKDKWALITGASRGIGKEIATALGNLGCNLVLHSRSVEHTIALAEELSANGVCAVSLQADISDPTQVTSLLAEIENAAPQIDILYNNAAIMMPYHDDVWAIAADEFRKSFETNVISQIRICNALIPTMIKRRWGRVVNLTSGIDQQPQLAPYAISKAALKKFVHDFVPMLEGSGVNMNSLDPGWLKTDMGGQDAPGTVESVVPGALVPILLPHAISGKEFKAQDYAGMSISQALERAEQH